VFEGEPDAERDEHGIRDALQALSCLPEAGVRASPLWPATPPAPSGGETPDDVVIELTYTTESAGR
jgi:hypothetical protein